MFASACSNAREYTFPIIISSRQVNGNCQTGIGTIVIINEEGWFVTAWHIVEGIKSLRNSVDEYNALIAKRKAIEDDLGMKKHEKMRLLNQIKINPNMVTNFSVFYGINCGVSQFLGIQEIDLAIGRLEGFKPEMVKVYPSFKDPKTKMDPGSSLCKLGFPFHNITPTFDDKKSCFNLPDGSLPIPLFPLEGIFTRNVLINSNVPRTYPLKYVETSSPGLRGQSGGPTFDIHGNIWAIQSQTRHLKLGFGENSTLKQKEKEILENQYLHVGWGIHSETIIGFLNENNVKYNVSL
jgi:hypothetical protein